MITKLLDPESVFPPEADDFWMQSLPQKHGVLKLERLSLRYKSSAPSLISRPTEAQLTNAGIRITNHSIPTTGIQRG
jgi:hypothetical protein